MNLTWCKKKVEINREITTTTTSRENAPRIREFLNSQGFRAITEHAGTIVAARGSKFMSLFNIGDPRRHHHTIHIVPSDNAILVHISIDSWFSLGTQADTDVYLSELTMLDGFLHTAHIDPTPLAESQAKRRRSDWRMFLILIGIGAVIGIVAVSILIGN